MRFASLWVSSVSESPFFTPLPPPPLPSHYRSCLHPHSVRKVEQLEALRRAIDVDNVAALTEGKTEDVIIKVVALLTKFAGEDFPASLLFLVKVRLPTAALDP